MLHVTDIFNIIGASFGVIGAGLIYRFGVPSKIDLGGAQAWTTEIDQNEIKSIARYKKWGNFGLILIMLSFLLQIGIGIVGIY